MVAKILLTVFLVALATATIVKARPAPDSCDVSWMFEETELVKQKADIKGKQDPFVQARIAHFEKCRASLNDQTKVLLENVPADDEETITKMVSYVADPDLDLHPDTPKKFAGSQIVNLEAIESSKVARGMLNYLRTIPELKVDIATKKDREWIKGVVEKYIMDPCERVYSGDLKSIVYILQFYLEKEIEARPENWEWLIEGRVCYMALRYKNLYLTSIADQYTK